MQGKPAPGAAASRVVEIHFRDGSLWTNQSSFAQLSDAEWLELALAVSARSGVRLSLRSDAEP